MLPKVHKRLYDVPRRPVISDCGFYIEINSFFIEFHLEPLAQKVKLYINDTTQFLRKIKLFDGDMLMTYFLFGNMVKNH